MLSLVYRIDWDFRDDISVRGGLSVVRKGKNLRAMAI